jgi:hypothetical protein
MRHWTRITLFRYTNLEFFRILLGVHSTREIFVFVKTILDQIQTLHAVAKGENRATFGADEILARGKPLFGIIVAISSI